VVITGATGGLGFETARVLCHAGAKVIIAGRNRSKGEAALRSILAECPSALVCFEELDLASLTSVANFSDRLISAGKPLDVLINNAGVMALPSRQCTDDGFERQIGVNYLGHFALTGRLLPLLRRGQAPRVVSVSSVAHRMGRIDLEDLQSEQSYNPERVYAQSKLAVLMFALELQRRSDAFNWELVSVGAHPGWVPGSDLYVNGPAVSGRPSLAWRMSMLWAPLLSHTVISGARSFVYAATISEVSPGGYYGPSGFGGFRGAPSRASTSHSARNFKVAASLWRRAEELTGVRFEH